MRITIVGSGYVGLVTGACLANTGNTVTSLDIDPAKIKTLMAGQSPIYEPGLDELLRRNIKAGRLLFTADPVAAYQQAEIIFICVGTPSDEHGHADLRQVLAAAADIGRAIDRRPAAAPGQEPIVVVKSTVPVGTNVAVRHEISLHTSHPFLMASNPEFLKEGDAIKDFVKPDRVVIGCDSPVTAERMTLLYEPFVRQGHPILAMDIQSAEMVKYASNAMLATKISFINEIANLCEAFGADIDQVRRGMCADERIGNRFLYPGLGYGGSCFPKDVLACLGMGRQKHTDTKLLQAVHEVNQRQRDLFMEKILAHFRPAGLEGLNFAFWGVAFKPGTDDVREAPSLTLIHRLASLSARVTAYDPAAGATGRAAAGASARFVETAAEALADADALVICTEWEEFRNPDFQLMRSLMRRPVIFDGRNLYRPPVMKQLGFTYHSIGRAAVK